MTGAATILYYLRNEGPLTLPGLRAVSELGPIRVRLALWWLEKTGRVRSRAGVPSAGQLVDVIEGRRVWLWRVFEAIGEADG